MTLTNKNLSLRLINSIMAIKKPKLSIAEIIWMSFGFMGIQAGFGLQNGNASRILEDFGAHIHQLSWFWLVAPLNRHDCTTPYWLF